MPNYIAMRHLKCAFQMMVRRCYASRKSCSEITVWMPWPLNRDLGGGAKWPSNHFRLYTVRCMCTEAQEMRAPCMFDWQGTQTFFSRWNAKSQIPSLVWTLRNSNIAITSLVCTLRNSKCTIQIIIQIMHFALVWKQSILFCIVNKKLHLLSGILFTRPIGLYKTYLVHHVPPSHTCRAYIKISLLHAPLWLLDHHVFIKQIKTNNILD